MLFRTILRQLISESLLLEDRAQDLIDADETGNLWSAREMGVTQVGGLMWINSMLKKNLIGDRGEPLLDVIPDVKAFFKPGAAERIRNAGGYSDIMQYRTPGDLRNAILSISAPSGEISVDPDDADIVYDKKSSEFQVVMPRTVKGSCKYGAPGWCTTRKDQGNLFLHYVASGRGIILFYILKKGANPRSDPTARLAVSTIKGKLHFSAEAGGLTVDGSNRGLTREKFDKILGDESLPVLDAIVAHAASVGNQHPAAKEVDQSVATLTDWKAATDSLKPEVFNDYLTFAFKERDVDREILEDALNDPRTTLGGKYYLFGHPNFDADLLIDMLETSNTRNPNDANPIVNALSSKKNISYEQIQRAMEVASKINLGDLYAPRLYQNPNVPAEALIAKYRESSNSSLKALSSIAINPNLPDDFIMEVFKESLDPAYKPTTPKAQAFMVDIARSRSNEIDYGTLIWDALNDPQNGNVFNLSDFYTKVAETLARNSENPRVLEEIAESALSGKIFRRRHDSEILNILRLIIGSDATPDSLIQRIGENTRITRVKMYAKARLADPENYSEEDVDEEYENRGDYDYDYD